MKTLRYVLLLICLFACRAAPAASYTKITQEEALALLEKGDVLLLDVRTEEEYRSGHIPTAVCIPNETIGKEAFADYPDLSQTIIVYCRSGRRSAEAARKLSDAGYARVYDLGGIQDWSGEITTEE
ncbi:MAG: rhodanese-like domain-containing protein [Erysipelotrichaceae bacterium]|nr:rhodanese-like domain-containing protein [Erysipelotrichaceae bacterium]